MIDCHARADSPISCPKCGVTAQWFISSSDVNRRISRDTFHYYRCSCCELIFLSPIPKDLSKFYEGGYQKIPKTLVELRAIAKKEDYRLEPILKYLHSGKLLEIGPWMGIFSCNAKDAGFDVSAIEMNQQCVVFLRDILGINAIESADPSATMDLMKVQFDVIAMWHCLEHMPRPWEVLRSASERLRAGGILLIAIPDIESYDYQKLRERWLHLDTPRHLCFYTRRSLERACMEYGLSKLEITTSDQLSEVLSKNAWGHLAGGILPVRYARRLLGRLMHTVARHKSKGHGSG